MPPTLSKRKKVAIAVSILTSSLVSKKRKERKTWCKDLYLQRSEFTHLRLLKVLDNEDFKKFMRMNYTCFIDMINMTRPIIEKKNTLMREAISAEERLIVTLRYLATGRTYEDLGMFSAAISPQSLSQNIIPETCDAIYQCLKKNIKMPSSEEEWKTIASQFQSKWNFSHCVGALDGKHVRITKPSSTGSLFYNYKKYFSTVLFGVVNANYEFMYINVGTNGCVGDGSILQNTRFYHALEKDELHLPSPSPLPDTNVNVPFVFLGDSAFPLNRHLMKPYPFKNIKHDERIFNYRLSRARRVVENAFGILSTRFRIFHQAIPISIENVDKVVLACCALHNYLSKNNRPNYLSETSTDNENVIDLTFQPGEWRSDPEHLLPLERTAIQQRTTEGKNVREKFTNYFNKEGQVSFQEQMLSIVPE